MTPDQLRAYRQMEADLVALLETMEGDDYATAANQLVAILRLTQITSGFVPNEEGVIRRFRPNPKLDALEEMVREQIGSQQILVWARYTEDVASICERMSDMNPVAVVGEGAIPKIRNRGINVPNRDDAERLFQSGERRLLVANPSAGGEGLNLWKGSIAAYYSQGYSLKDRLQSEDRCHRGGSEMHDSVTYVDFIAAGSVDRTVSAAVQAKKTVAEIVVDLRRDLGLQ
jgi:ERCC4-related helicase